jgi:nicotinate-nucleotide adenylyltransferase
MIGIIGGTFDPIHFGHLRPALEIAEKLDLDEVRFIPSATPPDRCKPEATAKQRLDMVNLAIKGTDKFVLDGREYQREGASYTFDTLQSIRDEIGADIPLCMILGMDAFAFFTGWHEWEKILKLCHIVISSRPNYDDSKVEAWMKDHVVDDSAMLSKFPAGKLYFSKVIQLDISATFIRKQIKAGSSPRYLTPADVVEYMQKHSLYQSKN